MRIFPLFFALLPGLSLSSFAQDDEASATEKLKDSVREWIETMREIQREEDTWEQDEEVLNDQRAALRSEVEELTGLVKEAKAEKAGADELSKADMAKRESLLKAKELMETEVRKLEESMVVNMSAFPSPLAEQPRVRELMAQVRADANLKGDEAKKGLTKRLNNVLSLLGEAEKWQQTVHLRDEMHTTSDGRKLNMKVIYFGLALAYAVDDEGKYGMTGKPGPEGWVFTEKNDLAPRIHEMVTVLNGDADAQFSTLPIELK